jgi:hypothetical protein
MILARAQYVGVPCGAVGTFQMACKLLLVIIFLIYRGLHLDLKR